MYAHINGTEIFFDVVSSGLEVNSEGDRDKPALLIHHGGPGGDHSSFRPWLDPLGDVAQVIYMDHRGTGRSADAPLSTYTIEQMADDVEALRRHLGLSEFMFLGHSYGGMVGQVLALRHPQGLSKLILSHTAPNWGFWEEAQEIAMRIGTDEQKRIVRDLFEGRIDNQEDYKTWWATCSSLYFRYPDEEVLAQRRARGKGRYEVATHMMAHVMPNYDVLDQLQKISVPTLVLASAHDWVTPPSQSEKILGALPDAQYVLLEDSGHNAFAREEQQAYLDAVSEFICRASGTS